MLSPYPPLIVYLLFFAFLARKNFRLGVGLFILLLPAYLVRFNLGPFPTTLLEVMFGILFLVWLIKYFRPDWPTITNHVTHNKLLFVFCLIFFASSIVSVFVSDMWLASLGQWRAYFLEPILVLVMLVGRLASPPHQGGVGGGLPSDHISTSDLVLFLALSTISVSVFGILQRFAGWQIGNVDLAALQTGRITSFFTSPNAVGLYLGPIILLMVALLVNAVIASVAKQSRIIKIELDSENQGIATSSSRFRSGFLLAMTLVAGVALFLTKSLGAWVAVIAGALLFIFLIGYKKIATVFVITVVGVALSVTLIQPNFLNKEKSGANRVVLWTYSWEYLTASPKNFVFGTGIRQFFRKIQKPYYNPKEIERLIYPHNIFLNFWTETGLVGMLSFAGILTMLVIAAYQAYKKNYDQILAAGLISALIVVIIHGLVDVPYFKNDLAMMFWIIAATTISLKKN